MTDDHVPAQAGIVERLRNSPLRNLLLREAAAEIERLQEHVDALLLVATSHEPEALRLQAEIERLRDHMRALADTSVDRDTAGIFKGLWLASEEECERLRAALQNITDLCKTRPANPFLADDMDRIARAALAGKDTP